MCLAKPLWKEYASSPSGVSAALRSTRERLLRAVETLFLRHGKDGVGLRQIAAEADVDVMLVRRYFDGKQQLFEEATPFPDDLADRWGHDWPHVIDWLLELIAAPEPAGSPHPLFALLRSTSDPAVIDRINARLDHAVTTPLTARIDTPDAHLRADLATALLVGIGVMRTVLHKSPLSHATAEQLRGPHRRDPQPCAGTTPTGGRRLGAGQLDAAP